MKKQKTLVVVALSGSVLQRCEVFGNKEEVQVYVIDHDEDTTPDITQFDRFPALGLKYTKENFRRFIGALDALWPDHVCRRPTAVVADKIYSWHQALQWFGTYYWRPEERRDLIQKWLGPYLTAEKESHGSELEKAEVHTSSPGSSKAIS